jgi:zeaxanthin glucosyltransferase
MKILMVIPSAFGHLNPSFFIAKILSKAGHQVVYLTTPDAINTIKANGFNYISSPIVLFNGETPFNSNTGFWERCARRLTGYESKFTRSNGELFIEAVNTFKPDIILLDSIITYNYLYLRKRFCVVFLQTMLSTNEDSTPPLTSSLLPNDSLLSNVLAKVEWLKYYIRSTIQSWAFLGDTQFGIMKRIFNRDKSDIDKLLIKRKVFQYGFKNIKEIILSPRSFDFPGRIKQSHQFHAGLCITAFTETGIDEFQRFLETLPPQRKIVYCSLGTVPLVHFTKREGFYKKLINVFSKRQEHLIISLSDFDKTKLGILAKNVHAFESVPQKYLLRRVAMMITHSGLNSVLECIYYNVPMLALPLNSKWDQNGNAARVVYHGLGLRGNIKQITETKLDSLVSAVIANIDLKKNLAQMKHSFDHDQNKVDVIELIEKTVNEYNDAKRQAS